MEKEKPKTAYYGIDQQLKEDATVKEDFPPYSGIEHISSVSAQGDTINIALKGTVSKLEELHKLREYFSSVSGKYKNVIFGMEEVGALETFGIAYIVECCRIVSEEGGKLSIYGCQPDIEDIMKRLILDKLLKMTRTEQEAMDIVSD